jgi:hypothetical protein
MDLPTNYRMLGKQIGDSSVLDEFIISSKNKELEFHLQSGLVVTKPYSIPSCCPHFIFSHHDLVMMH